MLTTKLRLFAAVGITLGLLGGAGAGVYFATAADPAKPVAKANQQPLESLPAAPPAAKTAVPDPKPTPEAIPAAADPKAPGEAALLKPFGKLVPAEGAKLEDILHQIEDQSELVLRVDVAAFRRVGALGDAAQTTPEMFLRDFYDTKVILPRKAEKLAMRDVMADSLAQVRASHPCTFQIRGSQLLIVPAYIPPSRPGADPLALNPAEGEPALVEWAILQEQIYGGVVSVTADRKPLADVLADLRKQTGANIILDPRCDLQEKKATVSIALNDVRLYDALRVISDMADLKMVYAGNMYYVTTPANSYIFQGRNPPQPRK